MQAVYTLHLEADLGDAVLATVSMEDSAPLAGMGATTAARVSKRRRY